MPAHIFRVVIRLYTPPGYVDGTTLLIEHTVEGTPYDHREIAEQMKQLYPMGRVESVTQVIRTSDSTSG